MIFSRTFDGLERASIEMNHKQHWEKLKDRYVLSPDQIESPKSLDDLAQQCVRLCRKYLFSEPRTSWRGWKMQARHGISCVVDVEQALSPALCDHLVVTFAHRFYCDNLDPKDMREYLAVIYDCQGNRWEGTKLAKDKDFQREQKKNAIDANSLKCKNYQAGITSFVASYKSSIMRLHTDEEGGRLSPGTAAILNREFAALDAWLKDMDLLAAPNWLFTVVMANNWKNHPFHVKKKGTVFAQDDSAKKNLLTQLSSFLAGNDWCPLLIAENPKIQKPISSDRAYKPLELKTGDVPFVCIPHHPDHLFKEGVPAQKYSLRGSQQQIEIPTATQLLFNNYLLEQSFHGYAIAIAMNCAKARTENLDKRLKLPFAIRLHAPLVHPELIRIVDAAIEQMDPRSGSADCLTWLDWFILMWNREALPILEELFLWGVHTYFDLDTLLNEIEASFTQRKDRLNRYRLISPADTPVTEYGKDQTPMINEMVRNGYLAGLGLKCADDPYTGIQVDPGLRTVFEN